MRSSVSEAFIPVTAPLEGRVPFLYLDVKGLVTVAYGNLVDTVGQACALAFKHPDGSRATRAEIAAEWANVKARQDMRPHGGWAFKKVTRLRLDDAELDRIALAKLAENEAMLLGYFPEMGDWPADAQLATHSMAWACGPHFPVAPRGRSFPRLSAALRARDFLAASNECRMDEEGNPGLKPRNLMNRTLYRNAAQVVASGLDRPALDPETLFWPTVLTDDRPTAPELENPPSEPPPFPPFDIVHPRVPLGLPSDDED